MGALGQLKAGPSPSRTGGARGRGRSWVREEPRVVPVSALPGARGSRGCGPLEPSPQGSGLRGRRSPRGRHVHRRPGLVSGPTLPRPLRARARGLGARAAVTDCRARVRLGLPRPQPTRPPRAAPLAPQALPARRRRGSCRGPPPPRLARPRDPTALAPTAPERPRTSGPPRPALRGRRRAEREPGRVPLARRSSSPRSRYHSRSAAGTVACTLPSRPRGPGMSFVRDSSFRSRLAWSGCGGRARPRPTMSAGNRRSPSSARPSFPCRSRSGGGVILSAPPGTRRQSSTHFWWPARSVASFNARDGVPLSFPFRRSIAGDANPESALFFHWSLTPRPPTSHAHESRDPRVPEARVLVWLPSAAAILQADRSESPRGLASCG